jgi:hypothetical protein
MPRYVDGCIFLPARLLYSEEYWNKNDGMWLVYPHERRVMSVPVTHATEMRIALGWQSFLPELAVGLVDEAGTW